jgi:hypothetical protein
VAVDKKDVSKINHATEVTVLPETPGSGTMAQLSEKDIYEFSTSSPKPYGDRIVELAKTF